MKLLTKRIGILGHGVEGTSLAHFFQDRRIRDLKIYDEKQEEFLDFDEISDRDVLFRSPGVSPRHPKLQSFRGKIMGSLDLFLQLCPTKKVIGITGTKGKGTVSTLIARMFEEANDTVFLAGNIGTPFFNALPNIRTRDVTILELSSFQLWDAQQSPNIAVLLGISEDHLEVHDDFEDYIDAKKNIYLHQKSGGKVVFDADCPIVHKLMSEQDQNRGVPVSLEKEYDYGAFLRGEELVWKDEEGNEEVICRTADILVPGRHQVKNILLAIAATKMINIKSDPVRISISKFRGLPHRLQLIAATREGMEFWNDSYGTNPAATKAAIEAMEKPTWLIVGGFSKKMNYDDLGKTIADAKHIQGVLTMGQTGKTIADAAKKAGLPTKKIHDVKDFDGVFSALKKLAKDGEAILLSPASASFDQFKNVVHRGEEWSKRVNTFLREKATS